MSVGPTVLPPVRSSGAGFQPAADFQSAFWRRACRRTISEQYWGSTPVTNNRSV